MLDYASLAAVAAVVREGSFERAARVLNVTTSAVSQRVKHLEERLGSVLIVRGQPCTATDTGRLLCSHVEQVGLLEYELHGALPKLAQVGDQDDNVTLRVAVNADSLATWFVGALAHFVTGESPNALVDIALDNEEHTVEWLRAGDVLAAVTAHSQPVQGFNSLPLGRLTYLAVATPGFVRRHFPDGVTAAALSAAPSLKFNHKDRTQGQWVRRVFRREVEMPSHWFPATQAFLDASLAGIGWGMNPAQLVRDHLKSGALVELVPGRPLAIPLYWQHTRLQVPLLGRLTRAVVEAAREKLKCQNISGET
jgi:LysR family transcriptional regulator, chromosome initiation inhibitor